RQVATRPVSRFHLRCGSGEDWLSCADWQLEPGGDHRRWSPYQGDAQRNSNCRCKLERCDRSSRARETSWSSSNIRTPRPAGSSIAGRVPQFPGEGIERDASLTSLIVPSRASRSGRIEGYPLEAIVNMNKSFVFAFLALASFAAAESYDASLFSSLKW